LNSLKTAPREKVISQLDDLITSVDLAEELRLAPNTVRKWTRLGILPAVKIGRNFIRYDRNAVRRAIARYQQKEIAK
jgi:hypothetical protein